MKSLVLLTVFLSFYSFAQDTGQGEVKNIEYRLKADCSVQKGKRVYDVQEIDLILRHDKDIVKTQFTLKANILKGNFSNTVTEISIERVPKEFEDLDDFIFKVKTGDIKTFLNVSVIETALDNEFSQRFVFPLENGYFYNCRFNYYY